MQYVTGDKRGSIRATKISMVYIWPCQQRIGVREGSEKLSF